MRELSKLEQDMVDGIAEHGFFSMHVLAEADFPGFTYSIGFWESVSAPEFLIYGLPRSLMHNMLWELYRQIKGGLRIEDGARVGDMLEGFDCIIRPIHPSHLRKHVGSALWYRRLKQGDDKELRAWQVFWPGTQQGLFPWEAGCVEEVRQLQPLLYLPDETGLA